MSSSIRLTTASQIKRFMARIINELNQDKIDPNKARALSYMCTVQLQAIEKSDLEKKVEELEQIISQRGY